MPPGQRQTMAFSVGHVAGRTSFNIMWHYAQVAERNQRATHIMSAPFNARARCGYFGNGERLAAGVGFLARCGAQLAGSLCCEHRARSSASTVWPPSLAAQAPASAFSKHQRQQNKGCRPAASAEGRHLAPAPTLLHWLRPARSRRLLARSRARHLRPVRPPPGASPFNILSCGLRQPAPGRRFTIPQASCGTARAAIKPGSLTKRLMAAADAAAMMWHRQTGKSQHGGSVSGGKSARRGVRVAGVLMWPKMLPEKHVASIG
ncbi:hypothetical protein [Pectobacterium versatile]|uniref:hypothetical protein n=1 Tax=Pectobacterium versatile TaxID=2488639 RepID=UPI001F34A539|nr:hypothetical protein [Pectobacterium versatile]